ncbi:MAG: EAL domain-containing protein [Pseudomonadota bacterium]|nr:EAL domain-containing protein [Pseudomonadota bacterium]
MATEWWTKERCDAEGFCYHELDVAGNILDVNQAWLDLAGIQKADVLGRFAGEFVTSDTFQNIERNFPILKDYGEVDNVYFKFLAPNKNATDVLLNGRSEYDESGNFIKTHCRFSPLERFTSNPHQLAEFVERLDQSNEKLRDEKNYLNWVLNSLNNFVLIVSDNQITRANKSILDFYASQTLAEFNQKLPEAFQKQLLDVVATQCQKCILSGEPCFELTNPITKQVHLFDCNVHAIQNTDSENVVILTDITHSVDVHNQLKHQQSLSDQYLDVAKVMMVALDSEAQISMINQAGCDILGYSQQELISQNWFDMIIDVEDTRPLKRYFKSLMKGDEQVSETHENEVCTKSGMKRLLSWKNAILKDRLGRVTGLISSAEDVTDLRKSQDELKFLAHHDVLTGLDNRKSLEIRLDQALKNAHRHGSLVAVCFIDLDNFKTINDSYGHDVGDELLIAVTKRIQETLRENDILARFGGDEFVVVLEEIKHQHEVSMIVKKLIAAFNQPLSFAHLSMIMTMSLGVSVYPDDGLECNTLFQNADTAMYEAKNKGKNQFALYNFEMSIANQKRAVLQQELMVAVHEQQFVVFYQPQLDHQNKKVVGVEALVRWQHPEKGLIAPDEFIGLAEEVGYIVPIGKHVLRQACLDIKSLHDQQLFDGYVSVNISGVQIDSELFFSTVEEILQETNIKPSMLEVEITESVVMTNPDRWISLFKNLKSIGLKIAIDDFGTGYSSLSQLSKLPLDKLKIDKSFVKDLPHDDKARSVAQAIINLSHSMNMETLAEGVETHEQNQYLNDQNCSIGQGYLFARPMPLEELKDWLKSYVHTDLRDSA